MRLDENKIKASQLKSVGDFVAIVKERTGVDTISNSTIHYHLTEDSDKLNYVKIGTQYMIVQDALADAFTPGNYYRTAKEEKPAPAPAKKSRKRIDSFKK